MSLHSTAKRDSPTLGGLTTAESVLVSPVRAHSLTSEGASMHDMLAASTKSSEIMLMTTSPVSMMLRKLEGKRDQRRDSRHGIRYSECEHVKRVSER